MLCCLLALVGCRGCSGSADDKDAAAKKVKEKPKDPYEFAEVNAQPYDGRTAEARRTAVALYVKPNHWMGMTIAGAKANLDDFVGRLDVQSVRRNAQPVPLPGVGYTLSLDRDAALPKGQAKYLESPLYVPYGEGTAMARLQLNRRGGRNDFEYSMPVVGMPSYQYHFLVLANLPSSYKYIESLEAVEPRNEDLGGSRPYYRLVYTPADKARWMVPSHCLQWTSVAYVLWDDFDAAALEPPQREALLDWLRWGGQLIISGPSSLESLRGSFLDEFLPAYSAGTVEMGADALAPLNAWWNKGDLSALAPTRPWTGIKLALAEKANARFVPGMGELVAEGKVGSGRIVVTAFRLTGRDWTTWSGCDSFFNSCLLGRPSRRHERSDESGRTIRWTNGGHSFDPAYSTALRYFTRDAGRDMASSARDVFEMSAESGSIPAAAPGMAAWEDFNDPASAARERLVNASRIEMPDRMFVVVILVGYLLVLVPLNGAIFWVMDRVEWAWIAAPVISIVCAAIVIRGAQLDIGFVRARHEIGVLELKGDSPRGHLTRYFSLYTSLTTSYQMTDDDPGAIILPFSRAKDRLEFRRPYGSDDRPLTWRRGEKAELEGVTVASNDYGLMHSEEMTTLPGPIQLVVNPQGATDLFNHSELTLHGVGLIRRTLEGKLQSAWIGDLRPLAQLRIGWTWQASSDELKTLWNEEWEESPMSATAMPPGEMNLRPLLALARTDHDLQLGEVRLIGWTEDPLPGLAVSPAARQTRQATVVLAELRGGFGSPPVPDQDYVPRSPRRRDGSDFLEPPPEDEELPAAAEAADTTRTPPSTQVAAATLGDG